MSIATLTGPNGLLSQADEARTRTNMAGAKEKVQLEVAGSYGDDGTLEPQKLRENLEGIPGADVGTQNFPEENLEVVVDGYSFKITEEGEVKEIGTVTPPPPKEDKVIPGKIVTEEQGNTPYTKNGTAVIPVGFAIVPNLDDVSKGLVISDKENDIADEGNQFVWIPVGSADDYKTNENYQDTLVSTKTQNDLGYLPLTNAEIGIEETEDEEQKEQNRQLTLEKEKDLVTTNMIKKYGVGGFYISRYEAGKESTTNTLVSKKGADVWVSIAQDAEKAGEGQQNCKDVAKTFSGSNSNVKSGLCTGIQFDMVMAFVNEKNDGEENKYLVETPSSSRHHKSGVEQSGQNSVDKVCNIYDLEGNCWEYVAEKNTYDMTVPYVVRGGAYGSNYSASYRRCDNGYAFDASSFRFVLYVM